MAILQQVGKMELNFLRKEIERRFVSTREPSAVLKRNAYLPNYRELREKMAEAAPEYQGAISARRLRKLFYYTDPEVCAKGQLTKARFNRNFLDACYLYATEGAFTRASFLRERLFPTEETPPPSFLVRPSYLIAALLLASLTILVLALTILPKRAANETFFIQDFEETAWEKLAEAGWEVWNPSENFPFPQDRPGWFALPTLPARQKARPRDVLLAQNLLVHPIQCDCCFLEVWMDFVPEKNWQQAGLLLIEEQEDDRPYQLFSKVYIDYLETENPLMMDSAFFFTASFKQDFIKRPYLESMKQISLDGEGFSEHPKRLFFRVEIDNDNITIWAAKKEKHLTLPIRSYYHARPRYLALFAIHGQTSNNQVKGDSAMVNAYFDYVKVRPCVE